MSENELSTVHLLLNQPPLLIRPELAVRLGLNEAIIVQQIHYWLENKKSSVKEKDLSSERTYINERFWTYDSYPEWQKQFPFWSVRTIERTFTSLEKMGILSSGCFNTMKADRTKWYTIDYDVLNTYDKRKKGQNVAIEQSATLAESGVEQSAKLAECTAEQSATLAPPIRQSVVSNPPHCGEQSANMSSPIPKTSSKTPTKTSNGEFFQSSSSSILVEQDYMTDEVLSKEEEEEIANNMSHLGSEIARSRIMRNNRQINEILKMMYEHGLLIFNEVDIERAISHYKQECESRVIAQPPYFFVKGFEIKLNERHSMSIGHEESSLRKKAQQSKSKHYVPFYNWLEERD